MAPWEDITTGQILPVQFSLKSGRRVLVTVTSVPVDTTVVDMTSTVFYDAYSEFLMSHLDNKVAITSGFLLLENIGEWYRDGLRPRCGGDPVVVERELRTLLLNLAQRLDLTIAA
jgi:hypothetical protein